MIFLLVPQRTEKKKKTQMLPFLVTTLGVQNDYSLYYGNTKGKSVKDHQLKGSAKMVLLWHEFTDPFQTPLYFLRI